MDQNFKDKKMQEILKFKLEKLLEETKDIHKRLSVLGVYCTITTNAEEIYRITANVQDITNQTEDVIRKIYSILDTHFTDLPDFIKNIKPIDQSGFIIDD